MLQLEKQKTFPTTFELKLMFSQTCFKWAILGLFFTHFWSYPHKLYNFYKEIMWKMSIKYLAMGFELRASWTRVFSHNHWLPSIWVIKDSVTLHLNDLRDLQGLRSNWLSTLSYSADVIHQTTGRQKYL